MREPSGWLEATTFETVVASTPLISIDLLVENERGEFLLGLRRNRPAQGFWFVPGGRVLKGETLDAAFKRLTRVELGVELERSQSRFVGLFEHFYDDSFLGEQSNTHYIVLGHHLRLEQAKIELGKDQHVKSHWVTREGIYLLNPHRYTLNYFESNHVR